MSRCHCRAWISEELKKNVFFSHETASFRETVQILGGNRRTLYRWLDAESGESNA